MSTPELLIVIWVCEKCGFGFGGKNGDPCGRCGHPAGQGWSGSRS